jgi:alpha-beta hydrolase superfamily lysophospholipase
MKNRMIKRIVWPSVWMLVGAVSGLFAAYLFHAHSEPPLQPWHGPALEADFRARNAGESFARYVSRENALLDAVADAVRRWETGESERVFDRYNPSSPSNPENHPRNWNRTFELEAEDPRGGILLVHGLSDSPYSMRALGELFQDRGFHVVGLRVPGHGTIPGALAETTWRDWTAAVRLAARHVAQRAGPDRPLWILGYSNGAALALDYTLGALEGSEDPVPESLVFLSPALAVRPVARLAAFQRRLASLPGFGRMAWMSNRPEFDPFKYSSFPVRAAEEIYGLTSQLGERIERMSNDGGLGALPTVLVFQSVVDSTIPPAGVVERLLTKLDPERAELVLFDVNRNAPQGLFRNSSHDAFLSSLMENEAPSFGLTIVTNVSADSRSVMARRRAPGSTEWSSVELGLEWPLMVYSLSHVAIPFPPDDPVYGAGESGAETAVVNIGGVAARGESALLALPTDLLMRLRYNPFFTYIDQRLGQEIERRTR